ncbi:helix-turn-helix domain-containing protein [Nonomuraea endophytica]|uniref:helix-turn-helix domain-containing protein n=1 Tax=Nonomuraea endophytica TaxID=714136 RepID=UPI0037C6DAB6
MTTPTPDPLRLSDLQLYTVKDVERLLRLSRSEIYLLLRAGRLASVAEGRARRITAQGIRDYIALLISEAQEKAA